jgi:hypothetical protein
MSLQEESDATFKVELNRENQTVEWFKDGNKIRDEPKRRIFNFGKIYSLRVHKIKPGENNGTYTFKVQNLETSATLTIIENPAELVLPFTDKKTVENKQVKFEVEFDKSNILDRLVWLKDDQEIDFSQDEIKERFTLFEDGPKYTLVIKKPHLEDEGQYTVKVRDSNVCSTACLSVTGKKNLF